MSKQGIFQNIKERLWKPSKKRQKLQDEDDWCDALEHLSLDSDDEYFDASEQQVTRRKRKIAHGKELSENKLEKKSEMHQPAIRRYTPSTSGVRSRRTYYGETSEERQRQIFPRHLHSGDLQFGTKDSSTSPPKKTEPFCFGYGRSNTAPSPSSEADVQVGPKQSATSDDPSQSQLPMNNYTDKDSTSLAPLPRAGDRTGDPPIIEINPEQPATTDGKSGKACQEDKSTGLLGWLGHILCWLGNSFLLFLLFGWLPWLRWRARPTRKPIIYLCTSSGIRSIHGLKKKLQTSLDSSRCVVQELELPYNRLEEFKFPSEVNRTDAMILCHSVHNRGFSITDVQNSIYDEFLKYCNQVFGKDHMVVVVHDFDNRETLKGQMETFQSIQPMTFKMAGLVVLAGKLDDTEVELCQDDLTQLEKFVKKFC